MLIYYLNIVLIVIWAIIFAKVKKYGKLIFILLSFLQMFLISLFRYNIGYDYKMYRTAFFRMGMDGFSKISYLDWEWGFNLYTKVIVYFTRNPNIFFGITAFICLSIVAWFIYKYSKIPWLSVLLYVNLAFFYLSMNFLRQSMALSISLIAWQFLKKRKFIPYLLIILIASTFHLTALIMIPVYVIANFKPTPKLFLLYGYGLLFFFIASNRILNFITNRVHAEYRNSIFLQGMSFAYSILPILFAILVIVFSNKMIRQNEEHRFLLNMVLFSTFWLIAMTKHMILERFSYYTYIYIILFIPELIEFIKYAYNIELYKVKDKVSRVNITISNIVKFLSRPYVLTICCVVLLTFIYGISIMYVGSSGAHGVFPYNSWIQKGNL